MDVNEMLVFARVVQGGSFTAAAAKLGMPKSTVSRKVSELEERLKSRLLQRTTRKLSLTEAGRTYYTIACSLAPGATLSTCASKTAISPCKSPCSRA